MKGRICALLVLVLVLVVGSCVQAADEQTNGGSRGRRRRRQHAAAAAAAAVASMMVPITLLKSAAEKGAETSNVAYYVCGVENGKADQRTTDVFILLGDGTGRLSVGHVLVCMDGTPPAYHLDPGSGSGNTSWIVNLEGGGWCNNARTCRFRTRSRHGSSDFMERQIAFTGIMSASPADNPDFFDWNRVKIRYCDSASFAGDAFDEDTGLYFRGQRIWEAAVQHLLSIGMASADQVLLTGCSAGGLATILHCDQFRAFFPPATTVKCLADAGLFLDAVDVSGGRSLRSYYADIVAMQAVARSLPPTCTDHLDATSCFFPQNIIDGIKTPIFLLNAAYDVWQIEQSLAPNGADPSGAWRACKFNRSACNASQMKFLQDFREQMVASVGGLSGSRSNGLFMNSCFSHCQSELPATWNNAAGCPAIQNKGIARSVGDWYFGRAEVKAIDCPYPCDNTCRHII